MNMFPGACIPVNMFGAPKRARLTITVNLPIQGCLTRHALLFFVRTARHELIGAPSVLVRNWIVCSARQLLLQEDECMNNRLVVPAAVLFAMTAAFSLGASSSAHAQDRGRDRDNRSDHRSGDRDDRHRGRDE